MSELALALGVENERNNKPNAPQNIVSISDKLRYLCSDIQKSSKESYP